MGERVTPDVNGLLGTLAVDTADDLGQNSPVAGTERVERPCAPELNPSAGSLDRKRQIPLG